MSVVMVNYKSGRVAIYTGIYEKKSQSITVTNRDGVTLINLTAVESVTILPKKD